MFVFCSLYRVERTKSDYDEQSLDQTGKIEDHVSFSFKDVVFTLFPDIYFHREK